ncbi:hypothetical protein NPIL_256321 [Nephila pilipes]|uniref:Uncharacterized protein n=1 Tax=Nephila pilipes TaxID=299642 RepID=A0A8X6UIF3_NEPPI|nr:hypothetical protein NPIL_256321 [Nephila pilipes]
MDVCLSCSPDLNEFETLKTELSQFLQKGGMQLHKWCCRRTPTHEFQTFPLDRNSKEGGFVNCSDLLQLESGKLDFVIIRPQKSKRYSEESFPSKSEESTKSEAVGRVHSLRKYFAGTRAMWANDWYLRPHFIFEMFRFASPRQL